jgi:hypothetical protein
MKQRQNKAALAALLGAAAIAIGAPALWPAFGQDSPESLLPPGFGEPVQTPPPAPEAPGAAPRAPTDLVPPLALQPPTEEEQAATEEPAPQPFELPEEARRPIDYAGPFAGYGEHAFGTADGRFLSTLMRRMNAPIASRWASIALRRALLTRVPTPASVNPADWIAERAWLLLRMGEADGARMLVQGVDVDRFTPKMYVVATQTALATADPAALCPLVDGAMAFSKERAWPLAQAMCAALSGDTAISSALINRAQGNAGKGIDLLLAEKVVGAGTNSRRAVNIEWDSVDRLTAWRFGLASAVGLTIPDPLFASAGPQVQAWRARAPMLPASARLAPARKAAALGVFSNAALVDLYGAVGEETDDYGLDSPAGRLRAAYIADDENGRLSALRALWEGAEGEKDRYGTFILTAQAAARIAPGADRASDASNLIASMLSAGLDRQAAGWAGVLANQRAADADPGWSILAVGAPRPVVDLSYARVNGFGDRAGAAGRHKVQMLVAALAGLGRISPGDQKRLAENFGVPLGARNGWTQALDHAVASGQRGTVLLLAAAGMQGNDWRAVPPAQFYHIIAALWRAGLGNEARMIAAEAMTRL